MLMGKAKLFLGEVRLSRLSRLAHPYGIFHNCADAQATSTWVGNVQFALSGSPQCSWALKSTRPGSAPMIVGSFILSPKQERLQSYKALPCCRISQGDGLRLGFQVGNGANMKLVVNMIMGAFMVSSAEGLELARALA